jgi:secretion/DNA translocation related TadE-like protein
LRPSSRVSEDRGAATVFAAILVAALLTVTVGGFAVGSVVLARHRAQSAADLAALAAAAQMPAGRQAACRRAQTIASAMRVTVQRCDVTGLDVMVTVSAETGLRLGRQALAAARAGPTARG